MTGEPSSLPATRPEPVYAVCVEGDDVMVDVRGGVMSELRIDGPARRRRPAARSSQGIDLVVRSGEVHAVMGPNGSGKSTLSHVIMGRPGYTVTGGSVTLDDVDVLALEPWQRAQAGLFLAMQYPTEVPGVSLEAVLTAAAEASGRDPNAVVQSMQAEAERIGFGAAVPDPAVERRPVRR